MAQAGILLCGPAWTDITRTWTELRRDVPGGPASARFGRPSRHPANIQHPPAGIRPSRHLAHLRHPPPSRSISGIRRPASPSPASAARLAQPTSVPPGRPTPAFGIQLRHSALPGTGTPPARIWYSYQLTQQERDEDDGTASMATVAQT